MNKPFAIRRSWRLEAMEKNVTMENGQFREYCGCEMAGPAKSSHPLLDNTAKVATPCAIAVLAQSRPRNVIEFRLHLISLIVHALPLRGSA